MNKLILEILPKIEVTTRKVTRITDQQNELRQFTIIKCYEYEDVVKRLHKENKLDGWLWAVVKNEYLRICKEAKNRVALDGVKINKHDLPLYQSKTASRSSNSISDKAIIVQYFGSKNEEYFEFDLDKFKPYLTYAEQMWIKAYKECGGKYAEIERQKNITKKVCRLRILAIIEKCKQLKRILY